MGYRLETILNIHGGSIKSLDIDPYGSLLASSSMDGTVKITDIATRQLLVTIPQKYVCEEIKFSENRPYIFCASLDGLIKCYDLVDRGFTREYYGHSSSVLCLDINGDRMFSGSADCTVRVWDVRNNGSVAVMKGHRLPVTDVIFNSGMICTCSMDGVVNLWDDRNHRTSIVEFDSSVVSMCFCGSSLLISTRRGIFEYDRILHEDPIVTMEDIKSLERYDEDHYIAGVDGNIILGSKDGNRRCFGITGSADNVKITNDGETMIYGGADKLIGFLGRSEHLT